MTDEVKNEIKLFLFYLSIAIVSGIIGFVAFISPRGGEGDLANQINLIEAWKQLKGLLQWWLLFFVIGGMMRLIFVYFFKKR